MKTAGERLLCSLGGFLMGGLGGWLIGMIWYFAVEVPYAQEHISFMHRDSYLCSAGNALPLLAIPGALIGLVIGAFTLPPATQRDIRSEEP